MEKNKQFEEWIYNNRKVNSVIARFVGVKIIELGIYRSFEKLPPSMQKGVYEEFFKSQGIQIGVDLLDIKKAFEILNSK